MFSFSVATGSFGFAHFGGFFGPTVHARLDPATPLFVEVDALWAAFKASPVGRSGPVFERQRACGVSHVCEAYME